MVGRPAKRNRQAEPVERGQQPVEQRAIFHGELPAEESVEGVVDAKPRLHRGKIGRTRAEGVERLAELAGLGAVLGIVDHNIFAARERQRVVERLWLGARLKLRHDDKLEHAGKPERARRGDRRVVVSLENI